VSGAVFLAGSASAAAPNVSNTPVAKPPIIIVPQPVGFPPPVITPIDHLPPVISLPVLPWHPIHPHPIGPTPIVVAE
jgi:hypothetical protein